MGNQVQGIVMEISPRSCIIMTREGEFHKVPRPARAVMVGEEIKTQLPVSSRSKWIRWSSIAAAMVIMLVGWYFYPSALPVTVAVAHVSLDINPSLELSVDRNGCVIDGAGYNDEGKLLLASVAVIGKDVYAAVADLIAVAIQQNYLDPNKENVVFTTIVQDDSAVESSQGPVVEEELVLQTIVSSIEPVDIPVAVLITKAKPELQQQAKQTGVSTGRFLLYQDALKAEPNLNDTDLKTMSLKDLKIKQWSAKHRNEIKGNRNNGHLKVEKTELNKNRTGLNNRVDQRQATEPNEESAKKSKSTDNAGQKKKVNEKDKDYRDKYGRNKDGREKDDREKNGRDQGGRDKNDRDKVKKDGDDLWKR